MAVARTEGNCRNSKSGGIGSFFATCFMKKAMPVLCTQAPRRRGDGPLVWGAARGQRRTSDRARGRLAGWPCPLGARPPALSGLPPCLAPRAPLPSRLPGPRRAALPAAGCGLKGTLLMIQVVGATR